MKSRRPVLLSASALAFGVSCSVPQPVRAVPLSCNAAVISGVTGASVTWTAGDCSIDGSSQVTLLSASGAALGTLTNAGQLIQSGIPFVNTGTIATVINAGTGTIQSSNTTAITNSGSIGRLSNQGVIRGAASGALFNYGTVGTLQNSGSIVGSRAIHNHGYIGLLTNDDSGVLLVAATGIRNDVGNIGALVNRGTITGVPAIENAITIGLIDNAGLISSSGGTALVNTGVIPSITNSGTISGTVYAISSTGAASRLGAITNTGLIQGNIQVANDLTVTGATGAAFGVFSGGAISVGSGGAGTLSLAAGNLWLQDAIVANLRASAATLKLSSAVSVSGGYSQTGGGLVIVTSNSGGSYGYLTVTGAANVSNTAITIAGSGLSVGETFTIVRSSTGGTYLNDTAYVTGTAGLAASVATLGNDLVVTLRNGVPLQTRGAVLSGAAGNVGAALDRLVAAGTAPADLTAAINAIDRQGTAIEQARAIKQLGPSQALSPGQIQLFATTAVLGAVSQHQKTALASSGPGGGLAAGSEGEGNLLWGQVVAGSGERTATAAADGYRMSGFGLASGVDHRFSDSLIGGVALSWMRAFAHDGDDTASSSTVDSYMAIGYGTYRLGRLYFEGEAGIGYNRVHQNRNIPIAGSVATADYGGEQYLLRGQTGIDLPVGEDVTVTPLLGLTFLRAASDGYTESGAGGANLTVDPVTVNSLTQDLGARLSWRHDSPLGRLTPEVRLAWLHDYTRAAVSTTASIAGSPMVVSTPRVSPDGALIGGAVTLDGTDSVSIRAEYTGELRPDYQGHTGVLKVLWGF
ncbi:autotransporter outer membrane beta-barrel domain-containing protein [Phaeospirillum tilakii]|uniref:Autotransporter domain-containing protein n=1 Tax=Phaeospirillum tilakii TaxID=741673 RepID=A0ABW5CCF3_9PROT